MSFCNLTLVHRMTCSDCVRFPGINPVDVFPLYNETTEVYGYIAYDSRENKIVLSYRGTSTLGNKLNDMNFLKTNYDECDGCQVHEGFYNAYLSIKAQTLTNI